MDVFNLIGGDVSTSSDESDNDQDHSEEEDEDVEEVEVNITMNRMKLEDEETTKEETTKEETTSSNEVEIEDEDILEYFSPHKEYKHETKVYAKLDTKLPADCVEVGPRTRSGDVVLACGTYHLDESTKIKSGHIGLYTASTTSKTITRGDTYGESAIFNMRWCEDRLGAVTADARFRLYRLRDQDESPSLEHLGSKTSSEESKRLSVHYTSLAWNPYDKSQACVSHSNGNLSSWSVDDMKCVHEWRAHSYEGGHAGAEVWSVSYFDSNVLLSGADDTKLKTWDLRDPTRASLVCSGHHEMGVTAIRILKGAPNAIITGSYDERIRMFDIRSLRKGSISSISCGGGVWQIRSATCGDVENRFVSACMRGGISHVSISSDRGLVLESSQPFDKELMYGVTCVDSTQNLNAGCSFYEHTLYLFS